MPDMTGSLLQRLEQVGFEIKTTDGDRVTTATAASVTPRA
jgi:hypothetical protein